LGESKEDIQSKMIHEEKGTLYDRILDTKFLYELSSKDVSSIEIESIGNAFTLFNTVDVNYLRKLEEKVKYFECFKNILQLFGVTQEFDIACLEEKDLGGLNFLGYLYFNDCIFADDQEVNQLINVSIANLNIGLFVEKIAVNKYKVYNLFNISDKHIDFFYEGQTTKLSPFLLITKDDLIKVSNINYEVMLKSITSFPINLHYLRHVGIFIIDAICAYEKTKNMELLHFLDELSLWIFENCPLKATFLHRMQILKRLRTLEPKDVNLLREIILYDEVIFKICACILLESFNEAKYFWDSLSKEEKEEIITTNKNPIYNMWTQNRPEELPLF
jgi:hypothetical protein